MFPSSFRIKNLLLETVVVAEVEVVRGGSARIFTFELVGSYVSVFAASSQLRVEWSGRVTVVAATRIDFGNFWGDKARSKMFRFTGICFLIKTVIFGQNHSKIGSKCKNISNSGKNHIKIFKHALATTAVVTSPSVVGTAVVGASVTASVTSVGAW